MSFKWPDKDADELLDYTVDWSRFLDTDTISTVTWYIIDSTGTKTPFPALTMVDALVNSNTVNTTNTATVYLGGGTTNLTYTLVCQISSTGGRTAERSIKIKIRAK